MTLSWYIPNIEMLLKGVAASDTVLRGNLTFCGMALKPVACVAHVLTAADDMRTKIFQSICREENK
jgi:hypothetical protein